MSVEVKVPPLPESVTDATLVAWHYKVGDAVRRDANLVDLETDKVVLEVPAPTNGVLKEIRVKDGTTVSAGDVLGVVEAGDAPGAADEAPAAADEADEADEAAPEAADETPAERAAPAEAEARPSGEAPERRREPEAEAEAEPDGRAERMGPAVRKLLEEHDLDAASIRGSGREGRITKADVLEHLSRQRESEADAEGEPPSTPSRPRAAPGRAEQRVPMTRLRARIAERLVEAQQTAAMLTTFNEADLSAVIELRKRHQAVFQERHGIKLGFMSFFVRAAVEALREFPVLNASIDGKETVYHEYFDIGVAVSTERGLVVPVLRDADRLSFADIELAIRDFGKRAAANALNMEDLTGGTFTITNGGIFGSMMSTPILNPPQSGILGMHAIQERPVVVDGRIEARPMMYLALTYDHRLVDGREAVQFLVRIRECIEDPARLILQI